MEKYAIVIFGGSGDLASRKLMPSLNNLYKKRGDSLNFEVISTGRTLFGKADYLEKIDRQGEYKQSGFYSRVDYLQLDPYISQEYEKLAKEFKKRDVTRVLFYLATPPSLYPIITANLQKTNLVDKMSRIIVEKPFGYDLNSGREMNTLLNQVFEEDQIYRIDHYLGKETVQNILALRFANTIFEPIWNRHYIDRVEITAVENMGIEKRGGFYDGVGALRDMVQNHLIQLLALVAMEPPVHFSQKEFRDEVVKVYNSLKPLQKADVPKSVIRGQYIEGERGGVIAKPYRLEDGVAHNSSTETFIAMKVNISNWRWEGVPFYIRTGKQMPTKVTEIVIHFKHTPHRLFSCREECPEQNQLIIRIQPNEGMVLKVDMKIPGSGFDVVQVPMEMTYSTIGESVQDDAYVRLIEEAMWGDATLFTRSDAVESSWNYFNPVLEFWRENPSTPLYGYPAGSWGPLESEEIIEGGHKWTNPCKNLTNTKNYCEL